MKFEFDSNNATELRAVEAAVAVLLDRLTPERQILTEEADPLVAAVTEAQQKLEAEVPQTIKEVVASYEEDLMLNGTAAAQPVGLAASELDSAGQPWNPDLHSSSRAKVADGTWKKKRGARTLAEAAASHEEATGKPLTVAPVNVDVLTQGFATPNPPTPPVPPTPVTPPAPPVPVPAAAAPSAEQKIWALITGQVVTINRVLEVARAHGHADLGALRQADEAAKAEVLKVLEGE